MLKRHLLRGASRRPLAWAASQKPAPAENLDATFGVPAGTTTTLAAKHGL